MLLTLDSVEVAAAFGYLCGAGVVANHMLIVWMLKTMMKRHAIAAWHDDASLLVSLCLNLGALVATAPVLIRRYVALETTDPVPVWAFIGGMMFGLMLMLAVAGYVSRHHSVWAAAMERDRLG